jgi:hypothetical protein
MPFRFNDRAPRHGDSPDNSGGHRRPDRSIPVGYRDEAGDFHSYFKHAVLTGVAKTGFGADRFVPFRVREGDGDPLTGPQGTVCQQAKPGFRDIDNSRRERFRIVGRLDGNRGYVAWIAAFAPDIEGRKIW